ncbi:unnamed protein product [marine sediment metagenome]|uniref:DUF2442 domain-containing protein n=1 Tax=marine sediment metagenome TaxID=412755 RepID=X1FIM0_9ZZZZ
MIHSVIQVLPQKDYTVYVYFDDGKIKLYDMRPFIGKGIFQKLSDIDDFMRKCTVMNNTLAWDVKGNYDPYKCIDIDPVQIYEKGKDVKDPLIHSA